MKTGIFMIGVLILVFLISGCKIETQQDTPICNKPYILVGNGCCLDQDDNSICDKDEVIKEQPIENEVVTSSNSLLEITCPKEIIFNANETQIEKKVEFEIKYIGLGGSSFKPTLKCDEEYLNPTVINVILEEGQSQTIKIKLKPIYKECEFSVIESTNINNIVSCKSTIKIS